MTVDDGMRPVSVAVVDDHPVVIQGLRQLLVGSRFQVSWQATSRTECVDLSRRSAPEIIILDLRLGTDLAPDVIREMRKNRVSARMVVLTAHEDGQLLRACLDAGVAGVLFKDTGEMDIVRTLEEVIRGHTVVDPRLAGAVTRRNALLGDEVASQLTTREYEVLRMVALGMTSREISQELGLAVNTVRSYVQSVLEKLNAHTRIEAISTARRLRLL